jgi:periplasmic copper chaperone A
MATLAGWHSRLEQPQRKEAMKLKTTLALVAALAFAMPAAASAHVTLQPEEAAAGDFTVLDVRVPNERDDSATTKVAVQFPPGFIFASYQPVAGWSVEVKMAKLAKPIASHGEEITEQVSQMTWTADSDQAGIQSGQFQDFPISVQIPAEAGDALTFKALQTYDDGEVVRWIGAPDSEEPAPQVAVTEGGEGHGAAPGPDASEESSDDSDSASKGLGIVALILGALGLMIGCAALVRSRRAG